MNDMKGYSAGGVDHSGVTRPDGAMLDVNERAPYDSTDVDYETADDTEIAQLGFPDDDVSPTPVFVVAPIPGTNDRKQVRLYSLPIDDRKAVRIVGTNRNRTRLHISNSGGTTEDAVFLLTSPSQPFWAGYRLGHGLAENFADIEMYHQDEVWGVCESGDSVMLSVLVEEYPAGDDD